MGNCCKCKRKSAKKIVLLLVGLDNAGKTVAVKGLAGENTDDSIPTVGFSVVNLNYLDYNVQIYDLGGGADIRDIWHRYFVDAHGVIFVVDASDYDRFNEVKSVLENLLSHRKISGKPLLVLANKQDNKEALDEIDIVENLGLEDLVNEKKCPTLVESCSAKEINQNNNKIDPGIENGYRWLLNYILKDYANLNQRVEQDVQEQKIIDDEQRRERIERLKIRSISEAVENGEAELFDVDPFRPISELFSDNNSDNVLYKRDRLTSPVPSVRSVTSCVHFDKSTDTKDISNDRPKSAVQIVKKQLEKSNRRNGFLAFPTNKTAPITLLNPKSAPVNNTSLDREEVDKHFRSSSESGQILTVTELPNAIIDSNGENIGDLFELNNFSTTNRKLPPIRQKSVDDYAWMEKPMRNSVNVMQTNIDEIYKDIS